MIAWVYPQPTTSHAEPNIITRINNPWARAPGSVGRRPSGLHHKAG